MYERVQVTDDMAAYVAAHMQPEDVASVYALCHLDPQAAIQYSLRTAISSEAWLVDGVPIAISGVGLPDLLSSFVCPWMLGTTDLIKHPRFVLTSSRQWTAETLAKYGWLRNCVDARHTRSIRWLKHLGFTIYPAAPLGVEQLPFHMNELKVS